MAKPTQLSAKIRNQGGTGRYSRGKQQIQRILGCAKELLLSEGYQGVTMRKIASKIDISPGTLTYYFRTREDLMRSMFEDYMENHRRVLSKRQSSKQSEGAEAYYALFESLLNDAKDGFVRAYFYQLWAASVHEPTLRTLREEAYALMLSEVCDCIKQANSKIPEAEVQNRAFVFCCMMEGVPVMLGSHPTLVDSNNRIEQLLKQQAEFLLR